MKQLLIMVTLLASGNLLAGTYSKEIFNQLESKDKKQIIESLKDGSYKEMDCDTSIRDYSEEKEILIYLVKCGLDPQNL